MEQFPWVDSDQMKQRFRAEILTFLSICRQPWRFLIIQGPEIVSKKNSSPSRREKKFKFGL